MSDLSDTEFKRVVNFHNKHVFFDAVNIQLQELGNIIAGEGAAGKLDNLEDYLSHEAQSTHLENLSTKILNWKNDTPVAIDSMAELLVIERVARDLRDTAGVTSHYDDIKDAVAITRGDLSSGNTNYGQFFDDLCLQLNTHLDNKDDYLGHKLHDLHLENVGNTEADDVEVPVVKSPSEHLTVSALMSAEVLDIDPEDYQP